MDAVADAAVVAVAAKSSGFCYFLTVAAETAVVAAAVAIKRQIAAI